MEADLDTLFDIPCFKCLFWNSKMESHLLCNPNECRILTKWLLEQAGERPQTEERFIIFQGASSVIIDPET
jgi:hypothetical protein